MAKKREIYTMSNGQPCTEGSVSGLSNSLLAMPWLAPWAAKMTACALAGDEKEGFDHPLWVPGKAYTAKEIEFALKEAKAAHRRKKDTAGDVGTDWHSLVGAYVEGQLLPEHVKDPDARRCLENFIKVTSDWEWLGSEITVVKEWCGCGFCTPVADLSKCPNLRGYGGTADGLARVKSTGMIILPDFKTSNHVAPTYSVQCMMYAEAQPVGDAIGLRDLWKEIKETRIVWLNKDLLTWEVLERSIDEHRPYLQHFIGCAEWNRRFNQPSHSTKDDAVKVSDNGETTFRSDAPVVVETPKPADSIFIK